MRPVTPVGRFVLSCGSAAFLAACHPSGPPATVTATVADSAGIPIITLDRALAEVAQGRAGSANDAATLLFQLDSLAHPVAVAFRASGEAAILDRDEMQVSVVDSTGATVRILGRRGDGPGEFHTPAGIAALGTYLVALQSWPGNILVRFSDGGRPTAVTPPLRGDWNGWTWQRPDIGLEFPSQSGPELWSRRIRALDDSSFLVYLGPAEGDTMASARALLLRFGPDLMLRDTVAVLSADVRARRPNPDGRGAPQLFKPVWGAHSVWAAGEGSIAVARSDSARVDVLDGSLRRRAIVRWAPAAAPVTDADRSALGDRILKVTLAASPRAMERYQETSKSERDEMMTQFMASFSLAAMRPEVYALFLGGGCLWMAGFDVDDDADGTAHEWLRLDLEHLSAPPRVVTIGGPGERVVAIERGRAATIRLDDDGFRRVSVYRAPNCTEAR